MSRDAAIFELICYACLCCCSVLEQEERDRRHREMMMQQQRYNQPQFNPAMGPPQKTTYYAPVPQFPRPASPARAARMVPSSAVAAVPPHPQIITESFRTCTNSQCRSPTVRSTDAFCGKCGTPTSSSVVPPPAYAASAPPQLEPGAEAADAALLSKQMGRSDKHFYP